MIARPVFQAVGLALLALALTASLGVSTALAHEDLRPLSPLPDLNPADDVVEVVLIAQQTAVGYRPDKLTLGYSYNGTVPGPLIDANLGDTLIVHFFNHLVEETTVHWHGVELPANMDGSSISQKPVPPGGYFRYEFKLLRAAAYWYHPHVRGNEQVERGLYGMLLVRDESERQRLDLPDRRDESLLILDDIELDEEGRISQAFPDDPVSRAQVQVNGREGNHLLVNGQIRPLGFVTNGKPHRLRLVNASNSRFMRISMAGQRLYRIGGDGGLLEHPVEILPIEQVPINGKGGNAMAMADSGATDRSGPMAAMDHSQHMMGMEHMPGVNHETDEELVLPGWQEGVTMSDPDLGKGLVLTPGERADLLFVPTGERMDLVTLAWHDMARGRHGAALDEAGNVILGHSAGDGQQAPLALMDFMLWGYPPGATPDGFVATSEADPYADWQPPANLRSIEPLDASGAEILRVDMGHSQPDREGNVRFHVTMKDGRALPFPMLSAELAPKVATGELRMIEVRNTTMGMHNFHIHGFMFQHIETELVDLDNPAANRVVAAERIEDKDTIILPARPGMAPGRSYSLTRLAIKFSDTGREGKIVAHGKLPGEETSGGWLYHCHILEHSNRGMMGFIQVTD